MKRIHVLLAGILLTVVILLGGAQAVHAYSFHSGDNVSLTSGKQIQDTVYAAGRSVTINSEIFGDVFCAGQNISITGTVHGDVICAGQTLHVSGTVDGDVRLAGQTVNLDAAVSGNATIAGQSFTLQPKGTVGGDLTIGSADSVLNGKVDRDVVSGGDNLVIGSSVGRNIKAGAATMKLTSDARVGGNIELTSKNDVSKDAGAVVSGKTTRTDPPKGDSEAMHSAFLGFNFIWIIYCFLAMLFTALALALLFPRLLISVTNKALPLPWKALLTGFIASFAVPIVIITLAATLIGIPLAILAGLTWLVILFLSGPLFSYYIGRLVLRSPRNALQTMLVGASIVAVLYFIPFLGGLTVIAALWIGSGMLLLELFKRYPHPVYDAVPAEIPSHSNATEHAVSSKTKRPAK